MVEETKALARERLEAKIEQVRKGGMKEYWLCIYIKNNYRKLGFSEMSGPYDRGYDFTGVRNGKRVVIEAERAPANFLSHGHNKDEVDALIVMTMDETPKKQLPKTIVMVDPEDLAKKTHEARKAYAIKAQAEREAKEKYYQDAFMMEQLAGALRSLYCLSFEEEIYEDTLEDDSMREAASTVALRYIWLYDLCKPVEKEKGRPIPEIVGIWHRVSKYGIDRMSERDWEHLTLWLGLLRDEYIKSA